MTTVVVLQAPSDFASCAHSSSQPDRLPQTLGKLEGPHAAYVHVCAAAHPAGAVCYRLTHPVIVIPSRCNHDMSRPVANPDLRVSVLVVGKSAHAAAAAATYTDWTLNVLMYMLHLDSLHRESPEPCKSRRSSLLPKVGLVWCMELPPHSSLCTGLGTSKAWPAFRCQRGAAWDLLRLWRQRRGWRGAGCLP